MNREDEWFDSIYLAHYDALIRFAYRALRDTGRAEDIVHNTFLTLLVKSEELQSHPSIRGWLFQTAKHKIRNELNRSYRKSEVPLPSKYVPAAAEVPPSLLSILPPGLSEDERQILYLYHEVGLSHKEIAAQLGCSQTASRMRLLRARQHCRSLIGEEDDSRPATQKQKIF